MRGFNLKGRQQHLTMASMLVLTLVAAGWKTGSQIAKDERVARVEQGLLPRAVPKGQVGKRATIADRMAYHGIPGMSMAVIEDGRIAWARAYGVRELEGRNPVTVDTLFQAASLSKPVSALGALLLVQQQRLELDADVRQWLRLWKPDQTVTLRQLLSHTAGLTVSGFAGYAPGAPLPTTLQILKGERPANNEAVRVTALPGKEVRYSGGGYVVVQQLITEVTQQSFEEYMRRAVFAPLGMTRSFFEEPLAADHARAAASGYRRAGAKIEGNWMVHPELAPAGLWTTPSDLARLMIELQDALAGRTTRTLQPKAAREMLTGRGGSAGLGVFLEGPNGSSRRFPHSGRNAGFDALLVAYKNGRQGAVVMINRNNNEGFILEVLQSIAREYKWPDYVSETAQLEYEAVALPIQQAYAGSYEADGRPVLTVVCENEKLFARSGEDAWFRMYPASDTEFFTLDNAARWKFVKGTKGTVDEVIVRSSAGELHRRRVK